MRDLVDPHIAELTRSISRIQEVEREYRTLQARIERLQLLIEQDQRRLKFDVQEGSKSSGYGI